MAAPLAAAGRALNDKRVSISFNLLGGWDWEPPLTTVAHTWSTNDEAVLSDEMCTANQDAQQQQQEEKERASHIFADEGALLQNLLRLLLWSLGHHIMARRGHTGLVFSGCFFVAASISLVAEHHLDLIPYVLSSGVDSSSSSSSSSSGGGGGSSSGTFVPTASEHATDGTILSGISAADLRDPDALLTLAASLQQQAADTDDTDDASSEASPPASAAAASLLCMRSSQGTMDGWPLHLKLRFTAELLRGGPSRSNWTELQAFAVDLGGNCGEWAEAATRWALALDHRLAEAVADNTAAAVAEDTAQDPDDTDGTASLALGVAAMRRQYALALVHTGDQPAALVQIVLALRNQLAAARPGGIWEAAELSSLPSNGWYDEQGILDAVTDPRTGADDRDVASAGMQPAHSADDGATVDAHDAVAGSKFGDGGEDIVYRSPEQHEQLFPMGFVHDLIGSDFTGGSGSSSSDTGGNGQKVGLVRATTALPNSEAFRTDLAPGAATGAAQPACRRAVSELCQIDLVSLSMPADAPLGSLGEPDPERYYRMLSVCIEEHRETVEGQCLMQGVGQPFLLRGAARRLGAYQRWSTDTALESAYGPQLLQTVEQEKVPRRSTPALSMTVSEFLRSYNSSDLYAITMLPAAMRGDVPIDQARTGLLPAGALSTGPRLWFSSGGTRSVLHKDMLDNVNCVIAGTKRVAIVHPRLSREVEAERWQELQWLEATVEAGDCLFIPGGWYHQVATPVGRSIAVNVFFQRREWLK
jgi:uncharacterized membrane protein YgcG